MRTISYDEFKAMRRFPAFDGLRAIAAALVFTFHFGGPAWQWTIGWTGVHLFFVLSGFLITTLLLREEERYRRISLRGFYIRRLFRIMPVYFVVLAATYALAHLSGTGDQVRKSLFHYLFLMNEFAPTNAFLHTWTIGIEQKFYIFWPLIAFALITGAFRKRLALTVVAILVLIALVPTAHAFPYWPMQYVVILVGCALAIIMNHPRGYALVRPLTHPVVATVIAVAFVVVHVFGLPHWPPPSSGQSDSLLGFYAVLVAILLPTLLSHSLPAKALSLRPMVFVGERSYSLYLVQLIALQVVEGVVPAWRNHRDSKVLLATLIVGLLASDLLYRWVEQPMIKVGRRFATRRGEPGGGSQPASRAPRTPTAARQPDAVSEPASAVSEPAGSAAPL
jgi:peptidoglycan/LPS O-acetylase OafA/YrhL